jgi:hypothetical protein
MESNRVAIKGENYPGINWDHYQKIKAHRDEIESNDLIEMRKAQKDNTSTDKPVQHDEIYKT